MVALVLNTNNFINNRYKNIKTNDIYYVTAACINTTNNNAGKIMLLYEQITKDKVLERKLYCREIHEFNQKFILMN